MNDIIITIIILGGLAAASGLLLAVASKKLAVPIDERITAIREALPGANCGGCGYAGCDALAAEIANGSALVTACPVGGAAVSETIAGIMGVEAKNTKPLQALVKCRGDKDACAKKFEYSGLEDCKAAALLADGFKSCKYGCLGFGTCVKACPFDAIHINDGGIAEVDSEKCKACGKCVASCPKQLIEMVPADMKVRVLCHAQERGRAVRGNCKVGCVGCQICVKACPHQAMKFEANLAKVDYDKCVQCGICAEKCPAKIIGRGR